MAIIGSERRLIPVQQMLAGMNRAARSVVRVEVAYPASILPGDGKAFATGFALTPQLVMTAGHVFDRKPEGAAAPAAITARLLAENDPPVSLSLETDLELLGEPMQRLLGNRPVALLRVQGDYRFDHLPISRAQPATGDAVYIVQYDSSSTLSLSSGRIVPAADEKLGDGFVSYDADTEPGGGGAPVFNRDWEVMALHVLGQANLANSGVARHVLLEALSGSRWWREIAEVQGFADVSKERQAETLPVDDGPTPSPLQAWQVRAALTPMIDPETLTADRREWLQQRCDVLDYLTDDGEDAERWAMRIEERHAVVAAAGSLDALKRCYSQGADDESANEAASPVDAVVRRILDGPPYELDGYDETALSWWVQAGSWLQPVAHDLPAPAEVARTLELRQFEASLRSLVRPDFQGREDLLAQLQQWYHGDEGPLMLHGIGGIGKSAVMSRFALDHPERPVTIWLDFDRPDLAPEDAHSVIAAIHRMAALRLPLAPFAPLAPNTDWAAAADALGAQIAAAIEASGSSAPPLLILDSFEAAQYSERYQELWPVIDRLATHVPNLRICVTGRAPVANLVVAGKIARDLPLPPLERDGATGLLAEHGITEPAMVDRILTLTRCIPLNLQLAVRAVDSGDKLENIPPRLNAALVAGFLQRRILGRIQYRRYQSLAEGTLVLRRLTSDMIMPILGECVDLPDEPAPQLFRELGRELGLVEAGNILRVRPEVRSPALALLDYEKRDWVAAIDRKAEQWYAGILHPERWQSAELVYHRLRLGDLAAAADAWCEGVGELLDDVAEGELGAAATTWLAQRQGPASPASGGVTESAVASLAVWEDDAARRIADARGRGLERIVLEILKERPDRSENSRLVFHEAFALREAGNVEAARDLLRGAGPGAGLAARDRTVLGALLARDRGDRAEADRLLRELANEDSWSDRSESRMLMLNAAAARVQLCVDFDTEVELLQTATADGWPLIGGFLAPTDALLPRFRERLLEFGAPAVETARTPTPIEISAPAWPMAMRSLRENWNGDHPDWRKAFAEHEQSWRESGLWEQAFEVPGEQAPNFVRLAMGLTELAWRRAFLLTQGIFPLSAIEECLRASSSWHRLSAALLGTIALFARPVGDARLLVGGRPLADAIRAAPPASAQLTLSASAWEAVRSRLITGVDPDHDWDAYARPSGENEVVVLAGMLTSYRASPSIDPEGATGAFLYSLVATDPLTALVEELAGVPVRTAQASAAQALGAVQADLDGTSPSEDDPNKNAFGGESINSAASLEAKVTPFGRDDAFFNVELLVRAVDEEARSGLTGRAATIHLHPTFLNNVQSLVFDSSGTIRLPLVAYGAFTVGVTLPDGRGRLELDLAEIDAPERFRAR